MRLLYVDVDTLRPDHLGCYGYLRHTSPNIDALAADGLRLDGVHTSDSPCLPSRSALVTGRFGINNGVVNHGGAASEPFPPGRERGRRSDLATDSWPSLMRRAGMWTATVSTFAERHSAFHWYAGFNEVVNLGTDGMETADAVSTAAIDWLRRRGRSEDWFLHVHFWDPHTPYRTPASFGEPFRGQARPPWITDEVIARHRTLGGPHSAREVMGFGPVERYRHLTRQPQEITGPGDVDRMFDGYDTGVLFSDLHIGRLLDTLADLGVMESTAVMVSSDHGETLGELGIYCDHQTADVHTHRVPAILRWPGVVSPGVDTQLRYQVDVAATVVQLLGLEVPPSWDGVGFAPAPGTPPSGGPGWRAGRDHLVLSAAAWATQRSVRFGPWLYMRTYHDAFHDFPEDMLFDVEADPHLQRDVASDHPAALRDGLTRLREWEDAMRARHPGRPDPLQTVLGEGGGLYVRDRLGPYLERLRQTGRAGIADRLAARYLGAERAEQLR